MLAIHVKKVLNRCKMLVDFAFFMASSNDEERRLRMLDEDGGRND